MIRFLINILKAVGLVAAMVIFAAAGVFCCVRVALTGTQAAHFLLSRFEAATNVKVSFSSAELTWPSLMRMKLILHHVAADAAGDVPKRVRIPNAELTIDLSHTLTGTFYVERAVFDAPDLYIGARPASHASPETSAGAPGVSWLSPMIGRLECRRGSLFVVDPVKDKKGAPAVVSDVLIVAQELTFAGVQAFEARGVCGQDGHSAAIRIAGAYAKASYGNDPFTFRLEMQGKDIPIGAIQRLASPFHPPVSLAQGFADLGIEARGARDAWTANANIRLKSTTLGHKALASEVNIDQAELDVRLVRNKDSLTILGRQLSLPGITMSLSASVHELSARDPQLKIEVPRADIELDRLFPLLPLKLLSSEDREHLARAGLKGHAVIEGLSWAGPYSHLNPKSSMLGRLKLLANLDKVSGFLPGVGLPITNATGEIRLGEDDVHFKGISFALGNSPIVLNGGISQIRSLPKTDLFLSVKGDAQDFQPLVQNMSGIERAAAYFDHLSELSGGVSVTLSLKGPLSKPEAKGVIALDNFECRVAWLPMPLKKVTGKVRFRSTGIAIPEIKGTIGVSPFVMKGNYTEQAVDGSLEINIQGSDLKRIEGFPKACNISGGILCKALIKGSPAEINYQVSLDLKAAALSVGQVVEKKAGVPLRVEAVGSRDASGVKVDDLSISADKMRISGRGTLRSDGRTNLVIHLPPRGIPSEALIPLLNPNLELQSGGRIEGDMAVGSQQFLSHLLVEANVLLNHVSLKLPGMHKRVEGLQGSIKHRPNSHQFVMERAKVGNSVLSGSLSVTDFENPRVEVILESPYFETTDFTAPPGYVHKLTWGQYIRSNPVIRFLARSRGAGFIKITKGKIGDRFFEDFRANLEGNGGLIRVNSWQSQFADGILRGTGLFDIRMNTTKPFSVDFQGDGLRMEKTMRSDPGWLKVSGNVTLEGHLEWKLGPSSDKRGMYKTGKIEVRMKDGMINRFDILSKLFSLVNLGSFLRGRLPDVIGQGLPFHHLSWNMEVFDDKWKVTNLRMLSDAARVDASGMYFAGQERIDFRMDVSPLVGFDAIFSGLFGNLLTRDGKLLTTTFRIRGLYSSPDVRLEPFENLRPE
ncbi:MAG: AsmA-like C-terminal domain-containing protein [Desulfomonilaceae bacterium]